MWLFILVNKTQYVFKGLIIKFINEKQGVRL